MSISPSPLLLRLVQAGYLRYGLITCWALALATVLPLWQTLSWFGATLAAGVIRSWIEGRRPPVSALWQTLTAILSCAAWAAAPLMAWRAGTPFSQGVAAVLLCVGYYLVFTQKRAAPREALVVSIPYSLVALFILFGLIGSPAFWPVLGVVPVLASGLMVKVLITQLKDGELRDVAARQAVLITELEAARDRADAANQAKSDFLAVISHELRTPMNGVLGAAQILDHSPLSPRDRGFVRMIHDSGERLLVLLNDLLDMRQIEAGKLKIRPEPIRVTELEALMIGATPAQAEAKGLTFEFERRSDLPMALNIDAVRVAQIVQNLLSNAVKFTSEGSVRLHLAATPTGVDEVCLDLEVSDTGPGMSEANMASLFQPFHQLDASSTRRSGGTGLGLSIARRLARKMGGDVSVTSVEGVGSVFSVRIVAQRALVEDMSLLPGAPCEETCGRRVLIAEDHPVNRLILSSYLANQGHEVCEAADGQAAIDIALTRPFDLILLDVNMPQLDGLEALRRLRRTDGPNQTATIALLSASVRDEDHEAGRIAGADLYVDKPVNLDQVGRLVARTPARALPMIRPALSA